MMSIKDSFQIETHKEVESKRILKDIPSTVTKIAGGEEAILLSAKMLFFKVKKSCNNTALYT